jgi:hypothetical protein
MLKKMKPTLPSLACTTAILLVGAIVSFANESLALASNAEEAAPVTSSAEPVATPVATSPVEAKVEAPAATTPPVQAPIEATPSVSDAAEKANLEAQKASITSKVRNPTLQKHLLENIDIFGKNDLPAIYILGPGIEDFEGQLLTRDFMRDPFFMQNVDREEFEMKMWLRGDLDEDFKKNKEEQKQP